MTTTDLVLTFLSRSLDLQADARTLPEPIDGFTYDFQEGYRRACHDVATEIRRLKEEMST